MCALWLRMCECLCVNVCYFLVELQMLCKYLLGSLFGGQVLQGGKSRSNLKKFI